MTGIYLITSPTDKVYIGQSRNITHRENTYKKGRCKLQAKLYSSIISHGWQKHKFEILHELPDQISKQLLDCFEILYIALYKSMGYELLNLRGGGTLDWYHHPDSIAKTREKNVGRTPWNKGKSYSKEYRDTLREAALKRIQRDGRGNLDRTGKAPWNKNKKNV